MDLRSRVRQILLIDLIALVGTLGLGIRTAWAQTAVGSLSNFDVVNHNPYPCHGFEIELEDLHAADVVYTFGGTYLRYGTPQVLDTTVDAAHPRALVRYRSWNGTQWEETPIAPANVAPQGHDCFENGPIGNYRSSGCEHFGVSLNANPTRTIYRWIVASNVFDVNSSFSTVPQPVQLPVPVWNVAPLPGGGGGVNVRAEVEPIEEENQAQFGEPQWMKVFKIESELALQPQDLVKLLLGGPDSILPGETEIETEWKLIQSKPGNAEGENEDADVKEDQLHGNKRSVIRRYEFYQYVGPRDAENNEALPCIADDQPVPADPPQDCADLGSFVGAQNAAVDAALVASPTPTATDVNPTTTPTPTPPPMSATPTATPRLCVGNCNGDDVITVDEIVTLVNIALGALSVSSCENGVPAGENVDVALIVGAVLNALQGCSHAN